MSLRAAVENQPRLRSVYETRLIDWVDGYGSMKRPVSVVEAVKAALAV